MKKLGLLFMALLAVFALTACGGNEESSDTASTIMTPDEVTEEQTITLWYALSGAPEEELLAIVDAFNAEWEGKFEVVAQQQGTYPDLSNKLSQASTSGDLPDLVLGYPDAMIPLIENGQVIALDDYITDENVGMTNYDDIDPAFQESGVYNDATYSIPFNKSTEVLYVNEELLAEAGVAVPTNYEELFAASEAIYEATGVPGFGADSLSNYVISASYNADAPYQTEGTVDLTTDEINQICNDFQAAIEAGYMRIAGEDMYLSGPFNSGQVAMYVGSTAGASYVEPAGFTLGVYPAPYASTIEQGTNFFMIDNGSAEKACGAWEFIKFALTEENVAQFSMATGYLPVLNSVKTSDEYVAYAAEAGNANAVANLFINDQLVMFSDSAYDGSSYVRTELDVLMQKIATDPSKTVEEHIADTQAAIDSEMSR